MLHHAPLTANLPPLSLASVFQVAAGRAWSRTRPTRPYHRTSVRAESLSSTLRSTHGDHDVEGAQGESSSFNTPSPCTASLSFHESSRHIPTSSSVLRMSASELLSIAPSSDMAVHRADRFKPSHPPSRRGVTFVNVESLSPHDCEPTLSEASNFAAYQSDPPWQELQSSVPELLPRVTCFRPKQSDPLPHPETEAQLLQNLDHAITSEPPASLGQVLEYHAAHPALHTTASFNLLIQYAIRCASFGKVKVLLLKMVREKVPGDQETRVLRVRCMVRSGLWRKAWQEELDQMRKLGSGIPLPVWLEFLGSVKRGAFLGSTSTQGSTQGSRPKPLPAPDPTVITARFHALMQHPPMVTADEWHRVPPRVLYAIVRSLIDQGRRETATDLTRSYFQALPDTLDEDWRRACLAIIHLQMTPGRTRNLSEHFAVRKTLFAFLYMHSDFQPTATTLFFLLRTLKYTQRCGERADTLVRYFRNRWGPDILDNRVRRRWASLWLKQRQPHRAEAILRSQYALDRQREEWRAEKHVIGEQTDKGRKRRLRWLDLHRSPRKNKERGNWRVLRVRIAKDQVRRAR